jgi:hypothetical protein
MMTPRHARETTTIRSQGALQNWGLELPVCRRPVGAY